MRSQNKKESNKQPVFAIKYDPRLPSIPSIQAKHWKAMVSQDQYLAKCFPGPPLTAFKRPTNLNELFIKAKVPGLPTKRPQRQIPGMTMCGTTCTAYPYIREAKKI